MCSVYRPMDLIISPNGEKTASTTVTQYARILPSSRFRAVLLRSRHWPLVAPPLLAELGDDLFNTWSSLRRRQPRQQRVCPVALRRMRR